VTDTGNLGRGRETSTKKNGIKRRLKQEKRGCREKKNPKVKPEGKGGVNTGGGNKQGFDEANKAPRWWGGEEKGWKSEENGVRGCHAGRR